MFSGREDVRDPALPSSVRCGSASSQGPVQARLDVVQLLRGLMQSASAGRSRGVSRSPSRMVVTWSASRPISRAKSVFFRRIQQG